MRAEKLHYFPRRERQLAYLAQFVDKIERISGTSIHLPDLLSRKLVASVSVFNLQINLADIARAQINDSEISELMNKLSAPQLCQLINRAT